MAVAAAGAGLSAGLLRRAPGQGARRGAGEEQGRPHRPGRPRRRHQGSLGPVAGAERGRQVLAAGHERAAEPGGRGHPDRGRRRPEGLPGRDHGRLPRGHGPDLHRPPPAAEPGLRRLQGPQGGGRRAEGHLPRRRRHRRRGRARRLRGGALGPQVSAIGQAWRRAWGEVVPFYAFPDEVRRLLYTTNAIEALNSKLRRAVRARGHFPTDEAAMKLLFLVLNRAEKEWRMAPGEWAMARAQFAVLFGERFTNALAG